MTTKAIPQATAKGAQRLAKKPWTRLVEHGLALVVTGLLLVMTAYSARLALSAADEGPRLRAATPLTASNLGLLRPGELYTVAGPVTGTFLNPHAYPEVKDALLVRARQESKEAAGGTWTSNGTAAALRLEDIKIGAVPVHLSEASRILAPVSQTIRELGGGSRLVIEATPGNGLSAVVFGTWNGTALADGGRDLLLLADAASENEAVDMIAKSGRLRALILGIVAAVLGVVTVATWMSARSGKVKLTEPA